MLFLHRALGTAPFRRIWHEALNDLQDLLWTDVLMRERFSTLGAAQFLRDLTAIWGVIDRYIPGGSLSALGMPRLKEAVHLLNLPTVPTLPSQMCLSEAYERVFLDNDSARKVIDDLGFETLTYLDARQVLQRRLEATDE